MQLAAKRRQLEEWKEQHKTRVWETEEVTISDFSNSRIQQIKVNHAHIVANLKGSIRQLQKQMLTLEAQQVDQMFRQLFEGKLNDLLIKYDAVIGKWHGYVFIREARIARYKVLSHQNLKDIQDEELQLRWEIKAYELLVSTQSKLLGLPPPRITPPEKEFFIFATQRSHGVHEIAIRNVTEGTLSLLGYSLQTKNGIWNLANSGYTQLTSGQLILIRMNRHTPGHLQFKVPVDIVALVANGKLICDDYVFSDFPQ